MASFDYAMITTATENIEIDDPANCCLLSEDQIKQNYLLVISTTLGITTMINYGPFIIDFDTLDLSNLQRQVIHKTAEIGNKKVNSAKARINEINQNIVIPLSIRQSSLD